MYTYIYTYTQARECSSLLFDFSSSSPTKNKTISFRERRTGSWRDRNCCYEWIRISTSHSIRVSDNKSRWFGKTSGDRRFSPPVSLSRILQNEWKRWKSIGLLLFEIRKNSFSYNKRSTNERFNRRVLIYINYLSLSREMCSIDRFLLLLYHSQESSNKLFIVVW